VSFFRHPKNQGLTKNFNACISRSIGRYVHILHGDDYVLSGFYQRICDLSRHPFNAALVCTRGFIVNERSEIEHLTDRCPVLEQGTHDVTVLIQDHYRATPAVVVRRSAYEAVGGFDSRLRHTADWEMWTRVIAFGGGLMANYPLACYRVSAGNDSGMLMRSGNNVKEEYQLGGMFANTYSGFDNASFRRRLASKALAQSISYAVKGDHEASDANYGVWRELANIKQRVRHVIRGIAGVASAAH
jgi:hypothetical protein